MAKRMNIESRKSHIKTHLSRQKYDGGVYVEGTIPTPYGSVAVYAQRDNDGGRRFGSLDWETDTRTYYISFEDKDCPKSFAGLRRLAFRFVMEIHLEARR